MKKRRSFKTKLWLYFVLFTAIIFSVLWLLQTVFLQSFYNLMLISNTRSAAQKIVCNAQSSDITTVIDDISHENSLLIYITDKEGEPLYISDIFKNARGKKARESDGAEPSDGNMPMKGKRENGYRSLPDNYGAFLSELEGSESGYVEISDDTAYVYGTYIDYYSSDEPCVLYVSAMLDPVGAAVTIIRIQLAIVTVFSLITGFVLAWFIAKRFSKPVSQLSDKAKMLGSDDYTDKYGEGFCAELDELSATLDRTSEKLRQSKAFQNELLANVSHDLRTPLTMIKGFAEEVGEYSWSDEEQRKADIGVIIRETDRLTALVNEILEYSELQSIDNSDEFAEFDLSVLVNRVADNFESLCKRDGYVIERETEENMIVNGCAPRVERAVYNLIDNAVRHTGEDKTVRIRLYQNDGVRLEVIDSGDGIDEELLPHIWEKYFTSRQRGHKGVSGLGLGIVKQIAIMHRAEYGVTSEKGKGSTFYLVFPQRA